MLNYFRCITNLVTKVDWTQYHCLALRLWPLLLRNYLVINFALCVSIVGLERGWVGVIVVLDHLVILWFGFDYDCRVGDLRVLENNVVDYDGLHEFAMCASLEELLVLCEVVGLFFFV